MIPEQDMCSRGRVLEFKDKTTCSSRVASLLGLVPCEGQSIMCVQIFWPHLQNYIAKTVHDPDHLCTTLNKVKKMALLNMI